MQLASGQLVTHRCWAGVAGGARRAAAAPRHHAAARKSSSRRSSSSRSSSSICPAWHAGSQQHSTAPLVRTRRLARAVAAASDNGDGMTGATDAEADDDDEDEEGAEFATCAPAFVMSDQSSPHYSAFSIDVEDYPGLLRVVSWVFNGMGCRVHNAVMKTSEDGRAQDVFWVTDLRGRKLSDSAADDVAARLEDFVSYCAPPSTDGEFTEFVCGDIRISNLAHPGLTQVTIQADLFSPGLLLEIASIIHGQGLNVVEGVVRGGSESPIPPGLLSQTESVPAPPPGRRVLRFLLKKGREGRKLGFDDVSALVYTLRAVLGDGNLTTRPPNTELSALSCTAGDCASPSATGSAASASPSGSDEPGGAAGEGGGAGARGVTRARGKGGVTLA